MMPRWNRQTPHAPIAARRFAAGLCSSGAARPHRFATRRAAMDEVIDWMGFYNHRRLHSTLDYVSPMQFEQRWRADQEKRAA